jgi:hypothetical protein
MGCVSPDCIYSDHSVASRVFDIVLVSLMCPHSILRCSRSLVIVMEERHAPRYDLGAWIMVLLVMLRKPICCIVAFRNILSMLMRSLCGMLEIPSGNDIPVKSRRCVSCMFRFLMFFCVWRLLQILLLLT